MSLLRRIRGALGVATLWGVTWGLGGAAFITWRLWSSFPRNRFPRQLWALHLLPRIAVEAFAIFAVVGAVAGVAFSLVLAAAERRRTVDSLSVARASVWGAVAGLAMTLGVVALGHPPLRVVSVLGAVLTGVGALSAATTMSLARRAPAAALEGATERELQLR
jgi:hypothetical protein